MQFNYSQRTSNCLASTSEHLWPLLTKLKLTLELNESAKRLIRPTEFVIKPAVL